MGVCVRKGPVRWSPFPPPHALSVPLSESEGHLQPLPGDPEQVWLPRGGQHFSWPGVTSQCLLADPCLEGSRDRLGSVG